MSRTCKLAVRMAVFAVIVGACGQADTSRPSTTPITPVSPRPTAQSTVRPPDVTSTLPAQTTSPATSVPPTVDSAPATVVARIATTRLVIALTFDAGSDAGNTARILDVL